jgi:hypothetical protein
MSDESNVPDLEEMKASVLRKLLEKPEELEVLRERLESNDLVDLNGNPVQ